MRALLPLLALAACGGRSDGAAPEPMPNRPLEVYSRQGLITGEENFPAVGDFATVAGPGDSTWVLFGVSLPTSALRFHRDGNGFTAGYSVSLRFLRGGMETARSRHTEQVRVATFQETGRTEESIFFQDRVLLEPGTYEVAVAIADSIGSRNLERIDTVVVPAYDPAAPLALVIVHEATGRNDLHSLPFLVLNSRHAAEFGGTAPVVYVESYDPTTTALELVVTDAAGAPVITLPFDSPLAPGASFRSATVELPIDSLPLGVLAVVARDPATGATSSSETLLVTISDQWMVANYDEVLDYLVYIASREEIEMLRAAVSAAERRVAWEDFWERRDPAPASAVNEYREEFFARVRVAAEQFAEVGRPGWRTDRGRVYIVLGAPDRVSHGEVASRDISGAFDAIEWVYDRSGGGRLELLFLDREGFGRFEMTRNSEMAFRSLADRLRVPAD